MIRDFDDLSKEQAKEWYASLKVGDEVIFKRYSSGLGGVATYKKATVHSVTKNGRISVLVDDIKHTFTSEGKYWGNKGNTWSRISYQLRQIDGTYINHRRKVIAQTLFEESMKKLEISYNNIETIEGIERYATVIGKALKELNL